MTEQTTTTPEQQQPVGVSLNDIALAVRIIDLAAERGAFKGVDMSAVGTCRDRLAAFVTSNAPKAAEETAPEADAEAAATAVA
jgi:hypothetical protein